MNVDHEILLHIIDGPGSGLTLIVLGFFAMIVALVMIKAMNNDAYNRGKQFARREGLENLQVTLSKLAHEQQEMKHNLLYREPGE